MARQRKEKGTNYRLKQPNRSGPDPTKETLLEIAEKRGLLKAQEDRQAEIDAASSLSAEADDVLIGRFRESALWSTTLTMLHFTLDVLVSHQYAVEIAWLNLVARSVQAFPIILLLFYSFHPHPLPPILLPRPAPQLQPFLHQLLFTTSSTAAGSYLIYITNKHGYYAVMKQSPPLGTLWIWSVIELDLLWSVASLIWCGIFMKWGGYSIL